MQESFSFKKRDIFFSNSPLQLQLLSLSNLPWSMDVQLEVLMAKSTAGKGNFNLTFDDLIFFDGETNYSLKKKKLVRAE